MNKERLLSFSDGLIAIVITLMVMQIEIPTHDNWKDLYNVLPAFIVYIVSFTLVAIHWVKHHHLFQVTNEINLKIIWANFNFLFWLSLLPFATGWLGRSGFHEVTPMVLYASLMLLVGISYIITARTIINNEGRKSDTARIFKRNKKTKFTMLFNAISVILAFYQPVPAFILLVLVKISWFIVPSLDLDDTQQK